MKVGSLVVYVANLEYIDMITPDKTEIYTVREIILSQSIQNMVPHLGIKLEEIVNGTVVFMLGDTKTELTYVADHFKEIQPPMEINLEELLKVPEECL